MSSPLCITSPSQLQNWFLGSSTRVGDLPAPPRREEEDDEAGDGDEMDEGGEGGDDGEEVRPENETWG